MGTLVLTRDDKSSDKKQLLSIRMRRGAHPRKETSTKQETLLSVS